MNQQAVVRDYFSILQRIAIYCFFTIIILVCLTACGTSTVKVSLQASKIINGENVRQSLPVQVRIYSLAEALDFNDASFHQLWRNDKQVLGDALIRCQEVTLNPGKRLIIPVVMMDETKYIGVLALFRHPYKHDWRILRPVPNWIFAKFTNISLYLVKNKIELQS